MSEKPNEDSMNIYDEVRKEIRKKQQAETERRQAMEEMFSRPKTEEILNQLRGKNQ